MPSGSDRRGIAEPRYCISDQSVGNILRRLSIEPAPRRRQQMNWSEFIRSHMAVLAGVDFFTVEVLP
jgi:hypothetical protein